MTSLTLSPNASQLILRLVACVLLLSGIVVDATAADKSPSVSNAWTTAAVRSGIPVRVIYGIAMTESGKVWSDGVRRPWPWTLHVNSPDLSLRYRDRVSAERALRALIADGITNVDVGPMQINLAAHVSRVARPELLLDPRINLLVAGDILKEFRDANHGDIALAVGSFNTGPRRSASERSKWYQDKVASEVRALIRQGGHNT